MSKSLITFFSVPFFIVMCLMQPRVSFGASIIVENDSTVTATELAKLLESPSEQQLEPIKDIVAADFAWELYRA